MQKKKLVPWLLSLPYIALYTVFVLIPLAGLLIKSFSTRDTIFFEIFDLPTLVATHFSMEPYRQVLSEPYYVAALWETVAISLWAVGLATVVGLPIAYTITRKGFRWRQVVSWFVTLPLYVPAVVMCYALLVFLGSYGLLNSLLHLLGLEANMVYNETAVILGTFVIILPMYVRVVAGGLERVSVSLEEASMGLGASPFTTFRLILLPLVLGDIVAAIILTLSYSMSLVVVAMVLGGGAQVHILPMEIVQAVQGVGGNIPEAAAMSVILLAVALLCQMLSSLILRLRGKMS